MDVISLWQLVIVGFWLSLTVTLKLQGADVLLPSVAVQVTGVVPFWNVAPDVTGNPFVVQDTVTPGQLSLAVTVKLTAAEH